MITKNRKYGIVKQGEKEEETVEVETYLQDVFSSYYSAFILNFGTNDLLQGIGE